MQKRNRSRVGGLWLLLSGLTLTAGVAGAGTATQGDAERGMQLYDSRCIGCHSLDANRIGPRHNDVFGREIGSVEDFDYSTALRSAVGTWNQASLDRWLADPESFLPGQRMNFSVSEPADRADLIAFLRQVAQR